MNLKRRNALFRQGWMMAALLLSTLPAAAQTADIDAAFDFDHILAYSVAGLLITFFVLVFYNRLYVYREQEINARNHNQNKRLALVLRTGKIRIWTYHIQNRHYTLLGENGEIEGDFNPVDFSQLYDRDDFEVLRSAVFDISENKRLSSTLSMRSNPVRGEQQRYYDVNITISDRDAQGKVRHLLGVQRDVTEERLRQQGVSQLLMRYHTVFNSSLVDMIYYDKNGVLTDINDKACRAFNIKNREELLRSKYRLQENPLFNKIDLDNLNNTHTTAIVDFTKYEDSKNRLDHLKQNGMMYYESTINPIYDSNGGLEGIYMAGRNVTEMVESFHRQQEGMLKLKKATTAIQEYINNINYALHVSNVRLVNYYPKTHTLELSNSINQPQLKLSQLRCIRLASPRNRRKASSLLNRMDHLTKRSIEEALETEFRDKKGRMVSLLFNMVPMLDEQGNVMRYFGMCRDMTEMIETERRLAVETKKAQETELLKQSFLTNMSYEIRTPLNTVVGFAELFEAEHDVEDEPVFVEEIKRNSNSLLKLVNDILFLSRLDANMIEYNKENVDFAQVFESHCQMGWSSVRPDVKTFIENPYEHLVVNIDQANLGQVIEKLCANAVYFTKEGIIRAKYVYRRGELIITIEDTGEGIDEQTLPKVFERFVRNMKEEHCGTGLDLPIVQALVEQMGGTIEIQSELGKGTTVWVTIPCDVTMIDKKKDILLS